MTGLHWAAKRGHFKLCEFLIKNLSHIDALDICGRTPLYLSLIHNYIDIF